LFGFPTPPSYIQATLKTHTTMKIEKTTPRPSFQPITVQFTIETKEELEALQTMSRFNVSIPELLLNEGQQEIIHDFLGMIQDAIID
jgi:hypothetical protein